jgi:hypothetical protein
MIGGTNYGPSGSAGGPSGANHKILSNTGGYGGIMTQGQAMHGGN